MSAWFAEWAAYLPQSYVTLLSDPKLAAERPLYWRFWGQAAIRIGDWKYIRAGKCEYLFNLADDIEESNNLILQVPDTADRLRDAWRKWNDTLRRLFDGRTRRLNE